MRKAIYILLFSLFFLQAETLFEVKDASNNKVLDVSTDGLRVMNLGDTLMVISSTAIKANIDDSKGLSRTFSVSTSSSKNKGLINALEVGTDYTKMGSGAGKYTDFSPKNIFIGLNSGATVGTGLSNVIIGNEAGSAGGNLNFSTFLGAQAGKNTTGEANVFIGSNSGQFNTTGSFNTYMGMWSGLNNNGSRNTYLGMWSGMGGSGDVNSDNILIGYMAGRLLHGSGNIIIGTQIDGSTYNNKLNIGNLIFGDLAAYSVFINGNLSLSTGAYVNEFSTDGTMTGNSDAAVPTEKAVRTYVTANKDNLGNHTATQNIKLSGYYLSNDGGNEGVYVDTGGDVGIGTNSPGNSRLRVVSTATGIEGSTGYFNNTGTGGIALSAIANTSDVVLFVGQNSTTDGYISKFTSNYGGGYKEIFNIANDGGLLAPYLATGTGTDLYITSGGEVVKYSSSKKYKKEIHPLKLDLSNFMKLQPVSFKWNEKSATENKTDYGLVAEEVEKVDSLLVHYNDKGETEGVDYQKINIMLLKVVQDQQNEIEGLKKEIRQIKEMIKK